MKIVLFSIFTSFLLLSCSTLQDYGLPPSSAYYSVSKPVQCVPYARKVSGIQIRGDAHTWWGQAAGRYERSHIPKVGAVMVLSKTSRLKHGHLAVVKRVKNSRTIEVEHSNWGDDRQTRSMIYKRMPVKDVTVNNDWSQVRFYNYPSKTFGSVYAASGFIYP